LAAKSDDPKIGEKPPLCAMMRWDYYGLPKYWQQANPLENVIQFLTG